MMEILPLVCWALNEVLCDGLYLLTLYLLLNIFWCINQIMWHSKYSTSDSAVKGQNVFWQKVMGEKNFLYAQGLEDAVVWCCHSLQCCLCWVRVLNAEMFVLPCSKPSSGSGRISRLSWAQFGFRALQGPRDWSGAGDPSGSSSPGAPCVVHLPGVALGSHGESFQIAVEA